MIPNVKNLENKFLQFKAIFIPQYKIKIKKTATMIISKIKINDLLIPFSTEVTLCYLVSASFQSACISLVCALENGPCFFFCVGVKKVVFVVQSASL